MVRSSIFTQDTWHSIIRDTFLSAPPTNHGDIILSGEAAEQSGSQAGLRQHRALTRGPADGPCPTGWFGGRGQWDGVTRWIIGSSCLHCNCYKLCLKNCLVTNSIDTCLKTKLPSISCKSSWHSHVSEKRKGHLRSLNLNSGQPIKSKETRLPGAVPQLFTFNCFWLHYLLGVIFHSKKK